MRYGPWTLYSPSTTSREVFRPLRTKFEVLTRSRSRVWSRRVHFKPILGPFLDEKKSVSIFPRKMGPTSRPGEDLRLSGARDGSRCHLSAVSEVQKVKNPALWTSVSKNWSAALPLVPLSTDFRFSTPSKFRIFDGFQKRSKSALVTNSHRL